MRPPQERVAGNRFGAVVYELALSAGVLGDPGFHPSDGRQSGVASPHRSQENDTRGLLLTRHP